MITDRQWERITDLWLNGDYSELDIRLELGIPPDDVEVAIRRIEYVHKVTRESMLEKVRAALDLED